MSPGATLPSLLCAALCLVSRAVSSENLEHGEDKDSLVSLSLTTPPAGDLEPINSSEEDRRHASAVPLDSGASFSASLLDASDTWTEPDRLRAGAKHLYTHLNGIQSRCMYLTSQIIQIFDSGAPVIRVIFSAIEIYALCINHISINAWFGKYLKGCKKI